MIYKIISVIIIFAAVLFFIWLFHKLITVKDDKSLEYYGEPNSHY